jgi:Reverse transcriptase (RNA-dependent DNA polymerase)
MHSHAQSHLKFTPATFHTHTKQTKTHTPGIQSETTSKNKIKSKANDLKYLTQTNDHHNNKLHSSENKSIQTLPEDNSPNVTETSNSQLKSEYIDSSKAENSPPKEIQQSHKPNRHHPKRYSQESVGHTRQTEPNSETHTMKSLLHKKIQEMRKSVNTLAIEMKNTMNDYLLFSTGVPAEGKPDINENTLPTQHEDILPDINGNQGTDYRDTDALQTNKFLSQDIYQVDNGNSQTRHPSQGLEQNGYNRKSPPTQDGNSAENQQKKTDTELTIHIATNNIAGLSITTNKLKSILQWMEINQYDILLAQEANVSFKHQRIHEYIRNNLSQGYHITSSESDHIFSNIAKPGGTFVISNQRMKSRIVKKIIDPAGRWAGNIYTIKNGTPLACISIYQIGHKQYPGETTSRAQQVSWLQRNQRNIDPLEAYQQDLYSVLQAIREEGTSIMVSGDFNEHDTSKGMLYFLQRMLGLVVLTNGTPTETHNRGKTCIDHTLVSHDLLTKIQSHEYKDYPKNFYSDHRPMAMYLKYSHPQKYPLYSIQNRKLYSNNWKNSRLYILHRIKLFEHYKISEKVEEVRKLLKKAETQNDIKLYEKAGHKLIALDEQHTTICLQAESSLPKAPRYKMTQEIRQANNKLIEVRYQILTAKKQHDNALVRVLQKDRRAAAAKLRYEIKQNWKNKTHDIKMAINKIQPLEPNGREYASAIKQRNAISKIKQLYRKISYYTEKRKDNEPLIIQSENHQWVQDPDDIAHHMTQHNKKHFSQAKGCPFSDKTLEDIRNPWSTILNDPNLPPLEKQFIHLLRNLDKPKIEQEITLDDWKKKYKSWKESTSTSPSGMHLGHYKSLLTQHYVQDDESCKIDEKLDTIQQQLFQTTLDIVNLSIALSFPLKRWTKAINIVIPKRKHVTSFNHLRNIHLYESDLNATLALKWKEALQESEKKGIIVNHQFGSRKKMSAHDPVYLEIAQAEISRLTREQYGQINYDARACYDRILPNIASMVSMAHGVPEKMVNLHHTLLKSMSYEVRIEGALEKHTFNNEENNPIYGTGQGSGNSPIIWLFLSNVLLKMFSKEAHGATYNTNPHQEYTKIQVSAYVDDVNTHHNTLNQNEGLERSMQRDFQTWKEILEMSGGKLAPEKCNFYIVKWNFAPTGRPIIENSAIEQLRILNTGVAIQQINNQHKSLGFQLSPTTPISSQKLQWKEIERRFCSILISNDLTAKETEVLYKHIYVPTIRYLLPMTSVTKTDIQRITQHTLTLFLRKSGYSNSTSRKAIFGAKSLGGLGWHNMQTEQGLHNLARFIQATNDKGTIGKLHQILLAKWSWYLGFHPWNSPEEKITYDTSIWLRSLHEFMQDHDIKISLPYEFHPLLRENDKYIMIIAQQHKMTTTEMRHLNYCRLYLNVITLSDIADEEGTYIKTEMYENQKLPVLQTSYVCRQIKPYKSIWTPWKKLLKLLTLPNRRKLKQPLGKWIVQSNEIRQKFYAYANDTNVYKSFEDGYSKHQILRNNRISPSSYKVTTLPSNAYPCALSVMGYLRYSSKGVLKTSQAVTTPKSYTGTIIAVTDASVVQNSGTWSVILVDDRGKTLQQQQGKLSGNNLTSFRAELDGCRAAIKLVSEYPHSGEVKLFCDNQAVIKRLKTIQKHEPSIHWPDYDILLAISQEKLTHITFYHVKGHQSSEMKSNLNLETNLNILMDRKARRAQQEMELPENQLQFSIEYHGKRVHGSIIKSLRREISENELTTTYKDKFKGHYDSIQWEAFKHAAQNTTIYRSIFKLIHNIVPNFETLHRNGISFSPICPLCFNVTETNQHILECTSRVLQYKTVFVDKVKKRLKIKDESKDQIIKEVYDALLGKLNGSMLKTSFDIQKRIGWKYCIRGFLTHEWIITVLQITHSDNPAKLLGNVIISIWETWHQAWLHRNDLFKPEDRFLVHEKHKQRVVDLTIIYQCKPWISEELQPFLHNSLQDHLKLSEETIDNWLILYKSLIYESIKRNDNMIWKTMEKEALENFK